MGTAAGITCNSMSSKASLAASSLLSRADDNGDKALSFSEFMKLGTSQSGSPSSDATSTERMDSLFKAIDSDSDGKLTEQELKDFTESIAIAMSTMMLQLQENAQFESSKTDKSATDAPSGTNRHDPRDTNKDGVVSLMERLVAIPTSSGEDTSALADSVDQITASLASRRYAGSIEAAGLQVSTASGPLT